MISDDPGSVRVSIDVPLEPVAAFDALVEELGAALDRQGIRFRGGPKGRVMQGTVEVGRITVWDGNKRVVLEWRPMSWEPDEVTEIELRVEPVDGGTRMTVEHRGFGPLIGSGGERVGWFASEIAAPFLSAAAPSAVGDWITDRRARRPSGPESREVYRNPLYHRPGFRVMLSELALTPTDHLLEVGCGGGILLKEALESGCRAAAVDHSPDMIQVAREANRDAVAADRVEILEANATRLPFPDAVFTCAAMTGVLGFLSDPVTALAEIRRVLVNGARLVVMGSDPELRGTPAAPDPMASRLRFYENDELANLAREAGVGSVRVVRRELEPFAREVGVPNEHLPASRAQEHDFYLRVRTEWSYADRQIA